MDATLCGDQRLTCETQLLLACAHTAHCPESLARIRALSQGAVDWAHLIGLSYRHMVLPLVYRSLSSVGQDAVPLDSLRVLQKAYRVNAVRNLEMMAQLVQALNRLEADGVRAVAYKGPLLADAVYGDLALRQFVDLDILVSKADFALALRSLGTIGYQAAESLRIPDAAYLRSLHHCALAKRGGVPLELHWDVAEPYFGPTLDVARCWNRLERVRLNGAQVYSLSPEDLLVVLSTHGAKHRWPRLCQVCDVAELQRARPDLDWTRALNQARRTGSERMVLLALSLAHGLLGVVPAPDVAEAIRRDPGVGRVREEALRSILGNPSEPPRGSERSRFFGFHLRARDRLVDRLRHCLRVAFLPSAEDWVAVPIPAALYPLYYVMRPARLAIVYLNMLSKRLRAKSSGTRQRV